MTLVRDAASDSRGGEGRIGISFFLDELRTDVLGKVFFL